MQHLIMCSVVFAILLLAGGFAGLASQHSYLLPILIGMAGIAPLWLSREFARRVSLSTLNIQRALSVSVTFGVIYTVALAFLFRTGQLTPMTCFIAMGVASLLAAAWWFIRNRSSMSFEASNITTSFVKNWFIGKWMVAGQLVAAVADNSIPWILAFYSGTAAVGVLAACSSILRLANPLLKAISNVLIPHASLTAARGSRKDVAIMLWKATAGIAVFMTIFFILIATAGGWALEWIFGPELGPYRHCLTILAASQWLVTLVTPIGCGIVVYERADLSLRNDVVSFVVTFLSALVLCYYFGVYGAASGLALGSLTKFTLTLGTFLLLFNETGSKPATAS